MSIPTLSDNHSTFVINSDKILINNNDDRHNSHISISTKGNLGDNDIEFDECNLTIKDGSLKLPKIQDFSGNDLLTFSQNSINFNNKIVQNLNFNAGSVTTNSIASQNYPSNDLEYELDQHLLLINQRLALNGHVANKVFVSSNAGNVVQSSSCVAGDLAKLGSGGDVDINTAKTSFPGFGTSASTALAGDTTTISAGQASAITTNTAKTSFPGFGTSASTALAGDTTTISAGQASAITANTAKTSFPGFGTSASTALVGNTTTISAGQASAITANTAKTSFPGFGTSASTALAGNTTTISSSQATAITNNSSNISANTSNINTNSSNISTNATDITAVNAGRVANQSAISINSGNISTNTSNVTNAKSKTDYIIVTQAVNLDSMESGIATNTSNISSNDIDIATNVSNISANTTKTSLFTKSGNQLGLNISPNHNFQVHNPATGSLLNTEIQITNPNCASSGASSVSGLSLFTTNYDLSSITGVCGLINYESNSKMLFSNLLTSGTPSISLETNGDIKLDGDGDVFVEGGQFLVENSADSDHQLIISRPSASYARIQTIEQGVGYNQVLSLQANDGRVAIGGTTAAAGLHVSKSVNLFPSNVGYLNTAGANGGWTPSVGYNIAIKTNNGGIWSDGFNIIVSSDRRIKENIVDVSDNKALNMLRDISCCWYNYKDRVEKGNERALGFIAQQVKKHLPEAVSIQKNIIPDKMKKIQTSWNDTKMSSNDLQDVSGIKYRFYVSNDISDNEKMVELVGDQNDCFTFEEKWENVFCYGKEVDDFHTLDKQKLFALNFSATQELDKLVATLTNRINVLEEKLK